LELGFLFVVVVSAGAGLVLRTKVSLTVGRVFLALGFGALILALVVLGLTLVGWGPLGVWTAGLVSVVLLGVAALALPFGLTVSWGRSSTESDAAS
jgi:hypothetical protein